MRYISLALLTLFVFAAIFAILHSSDLDDWMEQRKKKQEEDKHKETCEKDETE